MRPQEFFQVQLTVNSDEGSDLEIKSSYITVNDKLTLINLDSFNAVAINHSIIIKWKTESELNNAGFNIYRAESADANYIKINNSLIPSKGSPTQGALYEFVDRDVKNGRPYYYKLEDIDLNGTATMHGPVSATPRLIYGISNR